MSTPSQNALQSEEHRPRLRAELADELGAARAPALNEDGAIERLGERGAYLGVGPLAARAGY